MDVCSEFVFIECFLFVLGVTCSGCDAMCSTGWDAVLSQMKYLKLPADKVFDVFEQV